MLAVTTTAFAGYSPANVQAALKKMYPDAKDIAWSQDDGYYCADFMMNGLEKNVWFNTQAQWVMIQTELISTDRLTLLYIMPLQPVTMLPGKFWM